MVWAKSNQPSGHDVIIEGKLPGSGRVKFPPIKPGDPVCLSTYETDLNVIKQAVAQVAAKGLIRLMTTEEANAAYEKKAKVTGLKAEVWLQKAEKEAQAAVNNSPLPAGAENKDLSLRREASAAFEEDVINGRVIALCNHVNPLLKENQRMPAQDLLGQLTDMEESLSFADLQYIQARGFYMTVKKWAEATITERMKDISDESEKTDPNIESVSAPISAA